jgi:hypothetical protein
VPCKASGSLRRQRHVGASRPGKPAAGSPPPASRHAEREARKRERLAAVEGMRLLMGC